MPVKNFVIKILDILNKNLGNFLFNNGNLLSYNLFNFFIKKNIFNKKLTKDKKISSYIKNGYTKLDGVPQADIDDLNLLLKKYNKNIIPDSLNMYNYFINDEIFKKVKDIIKFNILNDLELFEKYFNLKIVLSEVKIYRTYFIPKNQKKNEAYSNFFHSDGYTCNLFKLFINLHNVDKTQGPLTVVKKEMKKIFKKNTGYNDRSNYQKENVNIEHCLHYNTGLKGDVLLCDTTELLHRAGDIEFGKHRDILFLDFLAYPFEHDIDIFHFQSEVCKRGLDFKYAKIVGFKKLFKLYQLCKKKRLVRN